MAKAKKKTKAEHVRELLTQNPDISYKDAAAALSKKGVDLSSGAFYSTKHTAIQKGLLPQIKKKRVYRKKREQSEDHLEIDVRTRLAMLEQQNQRLKAVIAALL